MYPSLTNIIHTTNNFNWLTDSIFGMLLNNTATYDRTDQFVADVVANELSGGTRVAISSPTYTDNGTDAWEFSAANLIFPSQATSQVTSALILYKLVTNDADSQLISFLDFTPLTTDGTDVTVTPDPGGYFCSPY